MTTRYEPQEYALQIEQLRLISDSVPALISYVDRDLRYQFCNRSYSEWFGRTREQIIGKPMVEVLGADAMHALMPHIEQALGGQVADFEVEVVYRHAGKRWIHAIYTPHRNAEGLVVGIAVLVTDISEHKRLETVLRLERERFSLALTAGSMGVYELDLRDDTLWWSPETYVVFGVSQASFTPTPASFTQMVHPEDRSALWKEVERSITARQLFVYEFRIIRPNGAIRWLSNRGTTEYDATGVPIRHFGIVTDVTQSKVAAEQIHRSEARLNAVLAHLREGVIIMSIRMEAIYWNPEALAIHGFPSVEETRLPLDHFQRLFELWTADGSRKLALEEWPVFRIKRQEFVQNCELRLKRIADDWQRVIVCSGKIVETSTGEELIYLSMIDVTEQRRIEAALRESEERHRQLAEALRQADRRKDEFLAMLAHELRNPLTPIRNSAYILERIGNGNPKLERLTEIVTRQVTHMARLIDDLLDVSRITRGKIIIREECVDLLDLIKNVTEDHRVTIEKSGLSLDVSLPIRTLLVRGDKTRLAQVFGNLLHNAHKFTPAGGRILFGVTQEGNDAVVRVQDSGIGMPPEFLGRVFEPFVQAATSLDRSNGGLGLGLALAKGIVLLHGGRISAQSRGAGTGSTFEVRLKLANQIEEEKTSKG